MQDSPNEIFLHIFSYTINPFSLLNSVSNIRHVNKQWFFLTETEFFWRRIIVRYLRPKLIFNSRDGGGDDVDSELITKEEATNWLYKKIDLCYESINELLDNDGIDSDDEEFDEQMKNLSNRYFKTHEFVDSLLQITMKSRYGSYETRDKFVKWK